MIANNATVPGPVPAPSRRVEPAALMKRLIDIARSRGNLSMYPVDAADNAGMAGFARHPGFTRTIDPSDATLAIHGLWP